MSVALFALPSQFPCLSCGATHIREKGDHSLCTACYDQFHRWARATKIENDIGDEDAVNRWLARKLIMDLDRLRRYGVTGRCEAVSQHGIGLSGGWRYGKIHQCRLPAIRLRDGRRCCFKHGQSTAPVFIDEEANDPYAVFTDLLISLSLADDRFRDCLKLALAANEPASQ